MILMDLVVLKQVKRELSSAPLDVRADIFSLFGDLAQGKKLGLPISRPLPSIAKGLHELRLSGRAGEFRVFYVIRVGDAIYIIHATEKKKQELDKKTADLIRSRLRSLGL